MQSLCWFCLLFFLVCCRTISQRLTLCVPLSHCGTTSLLSRNVLACLHFLPHAGLFSNCTLLTCATRLTLTSFYGLQRYCNVHMRLPRAHFSTTTLRITNGKASQPTTTSVQTLPQPYRSVNAACRSACRAARCYAVHAVVTADDDGNLSAHSAITRLGQRKP